MQNSLLFLESNTTGTGVLALHKAHALGLSPIFLTGSPHRYQGLKETGCAILACDTNSIPALHVTLQDTIGPARVRGITTTSEFYLEAAARLADRFHLPGNPVSAIRNCRDKVLTRLLLKAAGIEQPRFAVVRSAAELDGALATVPPPWVVKPADDTGSNNVRLCTTVRQVEHHAASVLATRQNVRGQPAAHTILVEEFLDAPELSVEMFSWQGTTTCLGMTEKQVTGAPYFVEQQHIFPAELPTEMRAHIEAVVRQALAVVGITHGATHTEVKLTRRGCAVVEINARLAGGMIPELIRHAVGVDVLEQQIKVAAGLPPAIEPCDSGHAGIRFLLAPAAGILEGIEGIAAAERSAGVEQVTMVSSPGDSVAPARSAYDRLGFVIARGSTPGEVARRLHGASSKLNVRVQEASESRAG